MLELNITKEDLKLYLTSGYLIFTKPIQGVRLGAAFVADTDGGDAEVLLLPPNRAERQSLALFTKSPTLEEHFKTAVLLFTDGTGDDLWSQIQSNPTQKKKAGSRLADRPGV